MTEQSRPVTVEELDKIISEMTALRFEVEGFEEEIKNRNKRLADYKGMVAKFLKELDRDSFVGATGWKIYQKAKWSVKVPQDQLDKAKLFDFMRGQGVYDKYATVHAQAFNSYYMAEWEAAKAEGRGMEFEIPGVAPPVLFEDIVLEKPRTKKV